MLTVTLSLLLAFSCSDAAHHAEGGHDDPGGHGHGEAEEDPRPASAVTLYQHGVELFMEFPALVVGQESPLIAHFTDVREPAGFVWVTEGRVEAVLRFADGAEERFVAEKLLRNGIFKPIVKPTRAGEATLSLTLSGHPAACTVEVGPVQVFPTVDAAVAAAPPEEVGEPTVGYLKESQWKTRYATAEASAGRVRDGVRATGEIRPRAGAEVELGAAISGRLLLREPLYVGRRVSRGELLAEVVPVPDADAAALAAQHSEAQAQLALAERALDKAKTLYPATVSERALREAEADLAAAQARAEAAQARLAVVRSAQSGGGAGGPQASFALRAPFDGVVVATDAVAGRSVLAGAPVATLVDPSRVWLVLNIAESDAPSVSAPIGASFSLSGSEQRQDISALGGELIAVGGALDPQSRTLPVIFELENPDGALKPGMFVRATVFTREVEAEVVIPSSAVLDDGGRPTVFVMEGGESFYKRAVTLAARDGGRVAVSAGVNAGERVVSVGAYEVLLSTASGKIPEHGHAH